MTSAWRSVNRLPRIGRKVVIWRSGWDCAPVASREKVDADSGYFVGWQLEDESMCLPDAVQEGFVGWNEDIDAGAMPTHWMPLPSAARARQMREGA